MKDMYKLLMMSSIVSVSQWMMGGSKRQLRANNGVVVVIVQINVGNGTQEDSCSFVTVWF